MSKTVRRKNYVPIWVTHDWNYGDDGIWAWHRVPKEGKVLAKALRKHHGDTSRYTWPSKWCRQNCQTTHRAQARMELEKFKQNYEYEVIIPRKKLLPWD